VAVDRDSLQKLQMDYQSLSASAGIQLGMEGEVLMRCVPPFYCRVPDTARAPAALNCPIAALVIARMIEHFRL
jgi:hypothetical protein